MARFPSRVVPFDPASPDLSTAASEAVTSLGYTVTIRGELHAREHVIINGRVEGRIDLPEHGLAVGTQGRVDGDIFARSITVLGTVTGTITADVRAELRATARVEGRLVSARLSIDDGAYYRGRIDTSRTDIASRVARYRRLKDSAPGA